MTVNVTIGYRPIMSRREILDFRAGNPWSPRARGTLAQAQDAAWGDPSHPGSEGRRAATWIEAARASVAELTGYRHVAFHPNRTSALEALLAAGHPIAAAPATARRSLLQHAELVLPVDPDGQLVQAPPSPARGFIVRQLGNEETGVRDRLLPALDTLLDATSALGRVPLPRDADVVIADARAWGSPVDLALVLSHRRGPSDAPVQVPEVVVAVDALTAAMGSLATRSASEAAAMDRLETRLQRDLPDVQFHGADRVPHIRSFSVLHLDAETLMRALDAAGYVVGSGSACVQDGTPSHVLAAMGRITHGNVRLALPVDADLASLDAFATTLIDIVARLRREAGVEDL